MIAHTESNQFYPPRERREEALASESRGRGGQYRTNQPTVVSAVFFKAEASFELRKRAAAAPGSSELAVPVISTKRPGSPARHFVAGEISAWKHVLIDLTLARSPLPPRAALLEECNFEF